MVPSLHPFTYEHYTEILLAILKTEFAPKLFFENPDTKKVIYIRHDIDNDINVAFKMALLEAKAGIKSTYLVLLRSGNYNPAERVNCLLLREIKNMGHDVGLHFSLIDHPEKESINNLSDLIAEDTELLSKIIKYDVRVFGFHNPGEESNFQIKVDGLINTYAESFFDEASYISESNMKWKKGCPCNFPKGINKNVVQLLIHPFTYSGNLQSDYEVLLHFLDLKIKYLTKYNSDANLGLRKENNLHRRILAELWKLNNYDR